MSCPTCDGDAFDDLGCPDSYHLPLKQRVREGKPSLYDALGLTEWAAAYKAATQVVGTYDQALEDRMAECLHQSRPGPSAVPYDPEEEPF